MPRSMRKTRDKVSCAGEVPGSRRREKCGGGSRGKKRCLLSRFEAGMCMKTNKTTTICPEKNRHFCITKRHFMQRHTYFAEIGGFFVTLRALRNAFLASKCINSRGRTPFGPTLRMVWTEVGSGLRNHAARPKKVRRFSGDVLENTRT